MARTSPSTENCRRSQVSAIFLLRSDGAALFQHRDNKPTIPKPDMWVIPGGHQDEEESSFTCAIREFEEETGYHCSDLHFLTALVDYNEITQADYNLNIYWGLYDGSSSLQCLEGQEVKFIRRDEAGSYLIPPILLDPWDQAIRVALK